MNLSQAFNDRSKQVHLELSFADKTADVGLIALNNAPVEGKIEVTEKKKKHELTDRLMRVLSQTRHLLQDFSERMDLAAIKANEELQHYKDLRNDRKTLTKCVDELKDGGVLARSTNGELLDGNLKNTLERYAKAADHSTDFHDDAYVLALASDALTVYPTDEQLNKLVNVQTKIVDKIDEGQRNAKDWEKDLDRAETMSEDEGVELVNRITQDIDATENEIDDMLKEKSGIFKEPIAQQPVEFVPTSLSF